jgi:hypothetical protein
MENIRRLEAVAKRAVTLADREQARGKVDGGIKQTVPCGFCGWCLFNLKWHGIAILSLCLKYKEA